MERIIKHFEQSKIQREYYTYIAILFIAVVIKYIIFLLLQIIDYFGELYYCDTNSEEYLFYGLRFLFFFFFLVFQIMIILTCILYIFSFGTVDEEDEHYSAYAKTYYTLTFAKIIAAFYFLWSIVLFATFIPRIIIFILYKEKFSAFITVLFSLKMFIMTLFYIEVLIIYILYKDISEEEKEAIKHLPS